jgi:hypothetical protein
MSAENARLHVEHSRSVTEIRDELRTANQNATYAAGFALIARHDVDADQRLDRLDERVSRVEAKLDC